MKSDVRTTRCTAVAIGAALAFFLFAAAAPAGASSEPITISVLSGRADLVSADNALVRIGGVSSTNGLKVTVGGTDRTNAFAKRADGTVVGLVRGLKLGRSAIIARAGNRAAQYIYGILSMGWRGSALHWHRYEIAYLLLAGLATPLVVSVHTVVSFDFAVGIVPGWHATIFPPYFVAGAIYAGFAMVLLLTIPLRALYGLKDFITAKHLDNMAKIMLATGLMVAYGYGMELFMAYYSGEHTEEFLAQNRLRGPYALTYYALIACNVITPQLLWFRSVRANPLVLFLVALVARLRNRVRVLQLDDGDDRSFALHRHRHLGQQHPDRLGLRHHQLCLVDRHRARGHADLSHFAPPAAIVADEHQPVCRSDDAVCGRLRRSVSAVAHGSVVVLLLAVSDSEHNAALAAIP